MRFATYSGCDTELYLQNGSSSFKTEWLSHSDSLFLQRVGWLICSSHRDLFALLCVSFQMYLHCLCPECLVLKETGRTDMLGMSVVIRESWGFSVCLLVGLFSLGLGREALMSQTRVANKVLALISEVVDGRCSNLPLPAVPPWYSPFLLCIRSRKVGRPSSIRAASMQIDCCALSGGFLRAHTRSVSVQLPSYQPVTGEFTAGPSCCCWSGGPGHCLCPLSEGYLSFYPPLQFRFYFFSNRKLWS